ncbi:MAG: radical SAM protein [Anaerolineae bacterium]
MSVDGPMTGMPETTLYDEIVTRTQRQHRLFTAHWELTYRCNEKCTHCYLDVFAPHADVPGELTTEECFRVMDELAALGALNLTFSGGEVLVRRDFFQLAEYARRKGFLLRLFTNGILINAAVADQIAALHPYAIEISLYSINPETHDAITQLKRSWELTTRAIRLLRERGVRVVIKTPVMRENAHELQELKQFAAELGAQFRYDITVTPKDSGMLDPLKHRLTDEDLLHVMRQEINSHYALRTVTDESRTCGITLNSVAIDPYGNVMPCLQVRSVAGNVRRQSMREIWEHSDVWQNLGGLTLSELPVCRTCELRSFCVRCHGIALAEDGDLRAPALVNCREALVRRQVLIEKGVLPPDHPIPAHLQGYVSGVRPERTARPANFIPLSALV